MSVISKGWTGTRRTCFKDASRTRLLIEISISHYTGSPKVSVSSGWWLNSHKKSDPTERRRETPVPLMRHSQNSYSVTFAMRDW